MNESSRREATKPVLAGVRSCRPVYGGPIVYGLNAIIDAMDAHSKMSTQAIGWKTVRDGLVKSYLDHESLGERG